MAKAKDIKKEIMTEEKRIVMLMQWTKVTKEQYEEARKLVQWEKDVPAGAVLHIATFDNKGLRVTDVWESKEDLDNFVKNRLMPGIKKLNITNEPNIEIYPLHTLFAPGL